MRQAPCSQVFLWTPRPPVRLCDPCSANATCWLSMNFSFHCREGCTSGRVVTLRCSGKCLNRWGATWKPGLVESWPPFGDN